jgi:RNA methyltransferase, TrmH family
MASIARVHVWYDRKKDWLQKQKLPVIAASLHGTSLFDFKTESGILVIGNESKGISDDINKLGSTPNINS